MDPYTDLPGGDNFYDVTAVFEEAARDMQPGGILLAKDFSLMDAMAAFEIGEPRFDSGMSTGEDATLSFNPLTPMLPEEICWILDRSLACEMEWHTGYTLSQTVFSFLYVHHLRDIDPDFISGDRAQRTDESPRELVTVVLRAWILGLLKCCDLAWREMNKGNIFDAEDWQSEKCDIPIAEAFPVKYVTMKLDEACHWLLSSYRVQSPWQEAIIHRLTLRKTLLELLELQLSHGYSKLSPLVDTARSLLQGIRSNTLRDPPLGSPAYLAFDPQFARRLVSYVPLHVHQLPSQDHAWGVLAGILDSLGEVGSLAGTSSISTWEIVGHMRTWAPLANRELPYIRSSTQSAFYDGTLILDRYPFKHILNCFFIETIDISYDAIAAELTSRWTSSESLPLAQIERGLTQLMIAHVKALWYSRPRRRRHCMKSLFDWHELYAFFEDIHSRLTPKSGYDLITHAQSAILLHRLSTIREVILSGLQLSLYSTEERVFAYWYLAQILEQHLACLDNIMSSVSQGTNVFQELKLQSAFLTALQLMSTAVFSVTIKQLSFSWQRMRLNFLRRYKWAFLPEYDDVDLPPVGHPNFLKFVTACAAIPQSEHHSPAGCVQLAKDILLCSLRFPPGMAGQWGGDRVQFIQTLVGVCDGLQALPATMEEVATFDVSTLKWDPEAQPWFPSIAGDLSH
ncbi:Mak10-domain-containing protein [Leucogyrophana mollusca]|uniref:Mak10-domain-containing protein n=1 Tax=Leucogyrophana mollusca TaxID=85980 RepID=A0ACB8BRU2_9AGAM|nr:Mak10-domain-containing protein [Leucogyrophana mollusca]